MTTSWPTGARLPRPRKKTSRRVGKARREARKIALTKTQLDRDGTKYVPANLRGLHVKVARPTDALRCGKCGGAIASESSGPRPALAHACHGTPIARMVADGCTPAVPVVVVRRALMF